MMYMVLAFITAFFAVFMLFNTNSRRARTSDPLGEVLQNLSFVKAARKKREMNDKQLLCQKEAPHMFDMLTLGLTAGLSFDSALTLYTTKSASLLSQELTKAQTLWRLGEKSRAEALEDLAQELNAPALWRFSAAVSEALEFGVPLAHTLVSQSKDIREEQKAQVEENIEKVPVKLLIPLGTLVVPAMLLAILGPMLAGVFG